MKNISRADKPNDRSTRYLQLIALPSPIHGSTDALFLAVLARRLLKSLSIKQGIKYDDPESAKGIPAFIEFHGLQVDEILDPLDSFSAC